MSDNHPPSFGRRLWLAFVAFLRALIRLVILVLTILLFAALVYFGVPMLYQQYLQPMEQRLGSLEQNQTLQAQASAHLQTHLEDMRQRLSKIEADNDTTKQLLDGLNSQAAQLAAKQETQMVDLLATQESVSLQLAQLGESLTQIEAHLATLEATIEPLLNDFDALEARVGNLELSPAGQLTLEKVYRELQLVKAMELLTRSRFSLVQNNYGLAKQDIEAAMQILSALEVPEFQLETLDKIIGHLEDASQNLPDAPVIAAEALELAWQLLKHGLPASATATPTPSPTLSSTGTLTPAPVLSSAFTPTPTP